MEVFLIKRNDAVLEVCHTAAIAKAVLAARAAVLRVERMDITHDQDGNGFTVSHPMEAEYTRVGNPWPPAKYRIARYQVLTEMPE